VSVTTWRLRPLTFLGRIIASWSAAFGGLDRLAVDDASKKDWVRGQLPRAPVAAVQN